MVYMKKPFPSLELLPGVFSKYRGVKAVYLFGSAASGKLKPDSDLDIGIVPADDSIHDKKLDLLTDLAYLGFCNVELLKIETSPIRRIPFHFKPH